MNAERWPREYAAEIFELPTLEARRAALADVPPHLVDFVKRYLTIWAERRAWLRKEKMRKLGVTE